MYQEDIALGNKLKSFARKHHAALVVVHHSNKREFQGDVTSPVLGSTGITAAADTVILWDRNHGSEQGILRFVGKDVQEGELTLNYQSATGTWTVLSNGELRDLSQQQLKILSQLTNSKPLGPKIIAEQCDLPYGSTRVLLRKMVEAGRLKCTNHKYHR